MRRDLFKEVMEKLEISKKLFFRHEIHVIFLKYLKENSIHQKTYLMRKKYLNQLFSIGKDLWATLKDKGTRGRPSALLQISFPQTSILILIACFQTSTDISTYENKVHMLKMSYKQITNTSYSKNILNFSTKNMNAPFL